MKQKDSKKKKRDSIRKDIEDIQEWIREHDERQSDPQRYRLIR